MTNQERNREALIDHIAEQDRIIRRRNEQIAAQVEIIEEARQERDSWRAQVPLADWEKELIQPAQNPRPLTADDGMLSRAVLEARKHKGTALALHSEVQAILRAALTEPKPRPEGAEGVESQIEQWLYDEGPDDPIKARDLRSLADFLAERGVRVVTEEQS